jgi:D-cysteine desulfhydrase
MLELKAQMDAQKLAFDRIVFATSSGGTQAGLVVGAGLAGLRSQVLGISVDLAAPDLQALVARLASETAALLDQPRTYAADDVHVNADYLGGGYAVLGAPEREALSLFAQSEGILLDPVYTGRAAAGLLGLIRRGVIARGETVLFWHTGGQPALFAYTDELTADAR